MSKFGFNLSDVKLTLVTEKTVEQSPEITDTPLDHALRYADLGWYVLPVRVDKKPVDGYGLNSCTNDPALIRKIWTEHPKANVAVACERSGIVVLDIDPRNGGHETLARLEAEHGIIYSAVVSKTQGGGEHRVFKALPGVNYPGTLGAGLDVKHRGYILVEPSRGESGAYQWRPGKNPTQGSLPTECPKIITTTEKSSALSLRVKPGSVIVAPETYADLRAALTVIPPEVPYDGGWLKVLFGLSRLSDTAQAYEIAREWSTRSSNPNHTEQDFKTKWRSLMHEDVDVNYPTVFYMADGYSREWRNRPSTSVVCVPSAHPFSLTQATHAGAEQVTMFEYLFDDFMSVGVNVLAGAPGVGKTTLAIPLALVAAHLCPEDFSLRPSIRRNVIIITESVVQVQRTIYSVCAYGGTGLRAEDFEIRIRVIPAHRLDPKEVAKVADEYREWTVDNVKADGTFYPALPLVVFDTANAVFELENENDNAEVGRALALTKQAFVGFPVLIISHTAKINGSGETDQIGPRGASAWTGDAQGVYNVFKDGDAADSPRVLKAHKVRFPTAYQELVFDLISNKERHPDVLGFERDVWFAHSVAKPLRPGERAELKQSIKEAKAQDEWVGLCNAMIDLVRQTPGRSRSYYERLTRAQGGPGGSQERKERAMTSLINDGCLTVEVFEKPKGRADHGLNVNEEVINSLEKSRYAL